jgi:hypothetical protein
MIAPATLIADRIGAAVHAAEAVVAPPKKESREFVRIAHERGRRDHLSATPERMAKTEAKFDSIATTDERGRTWEPQRLTDWPLRRLFNAGAFGNGSKEKIHAANQRFAAGERYYRHWFHGRSFPLGSRDYRKPHIGTSNDPYSIAPSQERVESHRSHFRDAEEKLGGDRIAIVTRAIVLEEKDPTQVGIIISGRIDKAQARAVAVEMLIDGLDRLRWFWDGQRKRDS